MANTIRRIAGPAYISNSAANIYTPPAATIITYIYQIHVANKTAGPVTYTLYIGATGGSAGGTEITGLSHSVAAAGEHDLYFPSGLALKSTDFLTGIASAATSLTITVLGSDKTVD